MAQQLRWQARQECLPCEKYSKDMNMMETPQSTGKGNMSVMKAILIGHLITTIPVFVIMLGFAWIGRSLLGRQWWIIFLIGFLLAWLWWAYFVPRWRKWAIQKGAPADRLHKAAVATGLVWKTGVVFEKTEIKTKDNE